MKKWFDIFADNLEGKNGSERRIIVIILLVVFVVAFVSVVYVIVFYTKYVLGLIILILSLLFLRLLSNEEETPPGCCPLYELIRHCLFEAVTVSSDVTGLVKPISEAGLDMIQRPPGKDRIYRFEYRLRGKRETIVEDQYDMESLKEVLNEELGQSFQKSSYLFQGVCPQCSSLYIEAVSPASGGFTVTIIPICDKTTSYVQTHYNRCLTRQALQGDIGRPKDDLF